MSLRIDGTEVVRAPVAPHERWTVLRSTVRSRILGIEDPISAVHQRRGSHDIGFVEHDGRIVAGARPPHSSEVTDLLERARRQLDIVYEARIYNSEVAELARLVRQAGDEASGPPHREQLEDLLRAVTSAAMGADSPLSWWANRRL